MLAALGNEWHLRKRECTNKFGVFELGKDGFCVDRTSEDAAATSTTAEFDPAVFSRFEYEFGCIDDGEVDPDRSCVTRHTLTHHLASSSPAVGDLHVSYIEPLVRLLRHPEHVPTQVSNTLRCRIC